MVNLSNEEILEIRDYIAHAVNKYNTYIYLSSFYKTLDKYQKFINDFQEESVFIKNPKSQKKINSFQKASYLLLAVCDSKISKDENINRQIAIDVALKIIENPVEVKGEYFNTEVVLENVEEEGLYENTKAERNMLAYMLQDGFIRPHFYELRFREIYDKARNAKNSKQKQKMKLKVGEGNV